MSLETILNVTLLSEYLESSVNFTRGLYKILLTYELPLTAELISFSDIQLVLLKSFLTLFLIITSLVVFYWLKYGSVISERFIKPSTVKEIEELKLSVARLKLPKEHTPRL
ncbi:uncharacterized protein LOC129786542 [Lutzomyia longipalpis]|uniref:uncharacterized protein LOC129786542 n=1 Tax=Lutzomyia longipalpis TaxID=7200 RepID=UPI0024833339|nr:uncharacterized protein LOC129786542 [Lutzomyia longipalpis]